MKSKALSVSKREPMVLPALGEGFLISETLVLVLLLASVEACRDSHGSNWRVEALQVSLFGQTRANQIVTHPVENQVVWSRN